MSYLNAMVQACDRRESGVFYLLGKKYGHNKIGNECHECVIPKKLGPSREFLILNVNLNIITCL